VNEVHLALGAALAGDGIPLHYGDLHAEFDAAHMGAVIMDRSHEARLLLNGRDRLALPQRISTNDVESLPADHGAPTVFITPVGRIIDRVTLFHRGESALLHGEPGRGAAILALLQRSTFFNDELRVRDLQAEMRQFTVIGTQANAILAQMVPDSHDLPVFACRDIMLNGVTFTLAHVKPFDTVGDVWLIFAPIDGAPQLFRDLVRAGESHGLRPAGSLTYNTLRIKAARVGVARELSGEYIPLEVGLWDEVSFTKGCYTGQEIIARMESRGKLAKTIVALELSGEANTPATLTHDGREIGTLTSSVTAPNGVHHGIGVVKMSGVSANAIYQCGEITAHVTRLAGVQPSTLSEEA
jgi:tRNA-modifying protein YgfZ